MEIRESDLQAALAFLERHGPSTARDLRRGPRVFREDPPLALASLEALVKDGRAKSMVERARGGPVTRYWTTGSVDDEGAPPAVSDPPLGLEGDDEETARYRRRKARERAEEARLAATKREAPPTPEEVLEDVLRVAGDKDTNPMGWRLRQISERRYREYGHFALEQVHALFGQFEVAKQMAHLSDKPGTRGKKRRIAQKVRDDHAARYLEAYVHPYVVKDPEIQRELAGDRLVLSISDTHATFLDPFTWWAFLEAARALQPDFLVFNGDILEGSEISSYSKIPAYTIPLQLEFDFAREMFRQAREACPDARIIWVAGNHGLDRLAKYLTQVATAFSGLRTVRFDVLADLEGLEVELAQGGSLASPEGQEDAGPGLLFYGFYRVYHGTVTGAHPAAKEMAIAGRSGQSGHTHRAQVHYGASEADMGRSWMSTPWGALRRPEGPM